MSRPSSNPRRKSGPQLIFLNIIKPLERARKKNSISKINQNVLWRKISDKFLIKGVDTVDSTAYLLYGINYTWYYFSKWKNILSAVAKSINVGYNRIQIEPSSLKLRVLNPFFILKKSGFATIWSVRLKLYFISSPLYKVAMQVIFLQHSSSLQALQLSQTPHFCSKIWKILFELAISSNKKR